MSNKPLVTVVLTTRNNHFSIHKTLASILAQPIEHMEVIIVDDSGVLSHSNYQTKKLVDEFIKRHSSASITLHSNLLPMGIAASRNFGARAARGHYITFINDGLILPHAFIKWQIDNIWHNSWDVCVSSEHTRGYNHKTTEGYRISPRELIPSDLLSLGRVPSTCITIDAHVLCGHHGFNSNIRFCDDVIFIYDMMLAKNSIGVLNSEAKLFSSAEVCAAERYKLNDIKNFYNELLDRQQDLLSCYGERPMRELVAQRMNEMLDDIKFYDCHVPWSVIRPAIKRNLSAGNFTKAWKALSMYLAD